MRRSSRRPLQFAEILGGAGQFAEAAEHALDASHGADEAGERREARAGV
ncbi:hypothetical protein ACWD4L_26195 [Streptomyces sp. NPDC002596]